MPIIERFAAAFNQRDVAGLVALFTEGASYADTFFGEHVGHAQLRPLFERMFHEGRDYVWSMEAEVETPERAAAEWTFSYTVSDAIPRSAGRRVSFRGMSFFELEDGKIAKYREVFDSGLAMLQLDLPAEAIAKILRRRLNPR